MPNKFVNIRVGTAGWSIPRACASRFEDEGTHLQRYATLLRCAEINSSFHRPHSASTYRKWRDSTPPDFSFSVKMPREISHERRLQNASAPLTEFLNQTEGLGRKRGPILLQLPPSLSFDRAVVTSFLRLVRRKYDGPLVCEPRHATWFASDAAAVLYRYRISRVAADPPPVEGAFVPEAWPALSYFRLHGSPRKYWSRYDDQYIESLAQTIRGLSGSSEIWCIFDNTASGAALENALELAERLTAPERKRSRP